MTLNATAAWATVDAAIGSIDPMFRRVLVRLHDRLVIEALANVGPIRPESPSGLFPPRRRYLDAATSDRRDRCVTARRVASALDHVTPQAVCMVHALLAGPDIADAGRFRSAAIGFQAGNRFGGAEVAQISDLVTAICAEVAATERPVLESAAQFASRLLTIHPFSDGNGRAARVLFDRLVQSTAPNGIAPSVDLWTATRYGYVAALRASDPDDGAVSVGSADPQPFVDWVCKNAASGADLWARRVTAIVRIADHISDEVGREHLAVALSVAIDRNVALDELDDLGHDADLNEANLAPVHAVNALVDRGLLHWDRRGLLQPSSWLDQFVAE